MNKSENNNNRGLTHREVSTKVRQQGELVGATPLRPTRTNRPSLF